MFKAHRKISAKILLPALMFLFTLWVGFYFAPKTGQRVIMEKESNWLPSPAKDKPRLMIRLYPIKDPALAGRWAALTIKKVR